MTIRLQGGPPRCKPQQNQRYRNNPVRINSPNSFRLFIKAGQVQLPKYTTNALSAWNRSNKRTHFLPSVVTRGTFCASTPLRAFLVISTILDFQTNLYMHFPSEKRFPIVYFLHVYSCHFPHPSFKDKA